MTDASTDAVLPCPFCGGEAEIWKAQQDRTAWIACMSKCSVLVSKEYKTDAEAIAAWNRRAIPAVQPTVKPLSQKSKEQTMSDMPERIWAWFHHKDKRDDVVKGGWDDAPDFRETEYVRADTIPAAEFAVKPLVWEPIGKSFHAFDPLFAVMAISESPNSYDEERAARVRSALSVTPHDPAKVQALVDALEGVMTHEPDHSDTLWQNARAALAAWKDATK